MQPSQNQPKIETLEQIGGHSPPIHWPSNQSHTCGGGVYNNVDDNDDDNVIGLRFLMYPVLI